VPKLPLGVRNILRKPNAHIRGETPYKRGGGTKSERGRVHKTSCRKLRKQKPRETTQINAPLLRTCTINFVRVRGREGFCEKGGPCAKGRGEVKENGNGRRWGITNIGVLLFKGEQETKRWSAEKKKKKAQGGSRASGEGESSKDATVSGTWNSILRWASVENVLR